MGAQPAHLRLQLLAGRRDGRQLAVGSRGLRLAELPPPRAQAPGGDAQPLGHPPGRHAALPLRHRRTLERFIVRPVRCSCFRLVFFAHGVDLPSPRAAVYFIRAISILDELNGLAAWSQAYAKSPYASLYPGFTVDPPTPAAPQLLTILRHKDQPVAPIYGKLAAEWQVDHWLYSVVNMALPNEDNGQFRSSFTGPILIQGEPATERFMAAAKAAIAQARPKKRSH